ncbi:ABC transporter permease [Rhodoferax sp.]|uniref:ABC transporter permease n=1 Tax=Rhodoferax sp. TaxID=50421 RepID=UPI0008BF7CB6|nr:ABC transporter permease [Rhodoferax sp.]OGB53016.1 MAG: ABC transporter permease [Burkholderiales bacterium RIFOXYD12_FULL_59_19]OGB81511.1 MAG: ABC transporter permease [Burkholderiales bacterium RIFOXYC12_FULL_60_6]OGB84300.1 MAG: ABC transporter permease [Burkholderiales bacterium RIFOXYD2_FULL_59_8]MDO8320355.1 ABC transporter permease [Rhodoferax sp.]MDP2678850.1 ABC transporter permease [Rhodoferax sp.]
MTNVRNLLPYWLTAPGILVMLAFVALPLVLTLSLSMYPFLPGGGVGDGLTLANYADIARDDYFHAIFARTFGMAFLVTAICIAIGVPEAYVLSRLSSRWRAVSMVIVLGPLLISVVVRTLGWAVLLGNEGVINKILLSIGVVSEPIKMMYTFTGVVVALVHVLVPFMVLAVWTSLQKLDRATEQAAASLGASLPTVLRRIVFPQVIPGVLSGGLIVFALAASAFATPAIIGGRRLKVVPTTIYDEFLGNLNWPLGAALAVVLVIIVLAVSLGMNRLIERQYKQVFS